MNNKLASRLSKIKKIFRKFVPVWMLDAVSLTILYLDFSYFRRVKQVRKLLADQRSIDVYSSIVKYRRTANRKHFPVELYEGNPWGINQQTYISAKDDFEDYRKHLTCEIYEGKTYFVKEIKVNDGEVFIDCGAWEGDTIDAFIAFCTKSGVEYQKIVGFEPTPSTFELLRQKHGHNPKITLINAGVYDVETEVSFDATEDTTLGNRIITEDIPTTNSIKIKVIPIDSLNLDKVSYIKMDIEGAELKALIGAKETIARHKPKMAICIYHSDEDMVNIPLYIKKTYPEYNLYVRQHERLYDTVLYAIPPS